MDQQQVHDIPRHAAIRGGGRLVRGQIGRMRHVTEQRVRLRREKTKCGIGHPLQLRGLAQTLDDRPALAVAAGGEPGQRKVGRYDDGGIALGDGNEACVPVVKDVDIAGKARAIAVERDRAGDIAGRAMVVREQTQEMRLKPSERHRTVAPCVQRDDGHPSSHVSATPP